MSCSYADGLSPYENKGKLGLKEIFDSADVVKTKVKTLASWIESSKHVVIHTGAGISTSAGIPDFRGPKGVWTLEAKGEKPNIDICFDQALPTKTHMAIIKLVQQGLVKYVVSQNIDGLHLKSGLSREYLSELHGDMYIEQCNTCNRQFVMKVATKSVGQKSLGRRCPSKGRRPCRGKTFDTILDWEAGLPEQDLDMAYYHSTLGDLNICLGTTLQINPSGNLPLNGKKKSSGKLVICNLQPTKHDRKADLIINTYVDDMMVLLMGMLDLKIDEYSSDCDLTKIEDTLEWTISEKNLKQMKTKYQQLLKDTKKIIGAKRPLVKSLKKEPVDIWKKPKIKVVKSKEDFELTVVKKEEMDEDLDEGKDDANIKVVKRENFEADTTDTNGDTTANIVNSNETTVTSNADNIKNADTESTQINDVCKFLPGSEKVISSPEISMNGVKEINSENAEFNIKGRTEDELDSGFSETPDEG